MTFGQKLYTLREERGWSQDELAEKADVSRQTVSNWENDKVQIDAEKLKRLAEIFGMGMDELYASAPAKPQPEPSVKPAETPKKNKRVTLAVMIVLAGLALCSLVYAIVGLCRAADKGQISSVVTLTGVAGLFIALVASVVVLAVCAGFVVMYFKKK